MVECRGRRELKCCKRCFNYRYVQKKLESREYFNRYNDKVLGEILLNNARYFFAVRKCNCGDEMIIELHFGTRCVCGGHCILDQFSTLYDDEF